MPSADDPASTAHATRLVHVSVLSTFRDMQTERDALVKRVQTVGVDLRWSITEEHSRRGETLSLCLSEIDRCRPYFVVMHGERYGWVAETIQAEMHAAHPWLDRFRGRSATELESIHGHSQ